MESSPINKAGVLDFLASIRAKERSKNRNGPTSIKRLTKTKGRRVGERYNQIYISEELIRMGG